MRIAFILLTAHFLGDWILQSRKVATTKSTNFGSAITHAITIMISLLVAGVLIFTSAKDLILFLCFNTTMHIFQDVIIWKAYAVLHSKTKEFKYWEDYGFYATIAIDQFAHLMWLFISYYVLIGK